MEVVEKSSQMNLVKKPSQMELVEKPSQKKLVKKPSQMSRETILAAISEVTQAVLWACQGSDSLNLSITVKSKTHTDSSHLSGWDSFSFRFKATCDQAVPFFKLLEVNCLPSLCWLVADLQDVDDQSHVALQTVDGCGRGETMLLWVEVKPGSPTWLVRVLTKTHTRKTVEAISTSLELKVSMLAADVIQCGRDTLDLLERIKLLNPKVLLSFSLHSLASVDVRLSNTCFISCGAFDVYSGSDLFLGHYSSHLSGQAVKIKASDRIEINFQHSQAGIGGAVVTCISCLVPARRNPCENSIAENQLTVNGSQANIRGRIRIQVYGPGNVPFDMRLVTDRLKLGLDSVLPWQQLGLQVKKLFSLTSFDLHGTGRVTAASRPCWADQCNHFFITLAFVVSIPEEKGADLDQIVIKNKMRLKILQDQVFVPDNYHIFQEAAYRSLSALVLEHRTVQKEPDCPTPLHISPSGDSEIYQRMIPDIASSLTHIYMRSTNVKFRSQVGDLVPTSSRVLMCSSLESSLWGILKRPTVSSRQTESSRTEETTQQAISKEEELEFSQDSLVTLDTQAMSPDSLDLEWEAPASTTLNLSSSLGGQVFSSPVDFREVKVVSTTKKKIAADEKDSSTDSSRLPQLLPDSSFLDFEKELEVWEQDGDAFSFIPPDFSKALRTEQNQEVWTCARGKDDLNNLCIESAASSSSLQVASLQLQGISSQSVLCKEPAHPSIQKDFVSHKADVPILDGIETEKMPRKRSSEYIAETSNGSECCSGGEDGMASVVHGKKQRPASLDISRLPVVTRGCSQGSGSLEQTAFDDDLFDQVEEAFSGDWYDEQEVNNWCAELDQ